MNKNRIKLYENVYKKRYPDYQKTLEIVYKANVWGFSLIDYIQYCSKSDIRLYSDDIKRIDFMYSRINLKTLLLAFNQKYIEGESKEYMIIDKYYGYQIVRSKKKIIKYLKRLEKCIVAKDCFFEDTYAEWKWLIYKTLLKMGEIEKCQ